MGQENLLLSLTFHARQIYPLDAVFSTPEEVPEEVKNNKRYAGLTGYDISSCAEKIKADFGKVSRRQNHPPSHSRPIQSSSPLMPAGWMFFRLTSLYTLLPTALRSQNPSWRRPAQGKCLHPFEALAFGSCIVDLPTRSEPSIYTSLRSSGASRVWSASIRSACILSWWLRLADIWRRRLRRPTRW